jgi:hypothetical protein
MHQVAVLLLLLLNGHISTGLPDVIRIGEFKIIASLPIYANSCEIFNEKCHFCMKGKFISLSAAARKNFARDSRSSSQADESAAARDHFSSALISLCSALERNALSETILTMREIARAVPMLRRARKF